MNRTDLPIDMGTTTPLKVPRNGGMQYIAFTGTLIAYMSSDPRKERDRWTELRIFKTKAGRYVGVSVGCTVIPHEFDFIDCEMADTLEGLTTFFTVDGKRTGLSSALFGQVVDQLSNGVEYA